MKLFERNRNIGVIVARETIVAKEDNNAKRTKTNKVKKMEKMVIPQALWIGTFFFFFFKLDHSLIKERECNCQSTKKLDRIMDSPGVL